MKPIYKIIIIISIIIIIGLIIYWGWQAFTKPPSLPAEIPFPEKTKETSKTPNLKKLSDQQIFNFWVIPDTKNIFYFTFDGKVFNLQEGKNVLISNQSINALNNAVLSPDNQKILVSFGDPRQPQWGIFDLIEQIWRPLPSELIKTTWGENSQQLVAIIKKENDFNLSKIDLTKNPPVYQTIIKDFRFKEVDLFLRSPQELLIIEKPSSFYGSRVWQLNLNDLSFTSLIPPTHSLILKWSADKNVIFKFSYPNNFSILDKDFKEMVPILFSQTLPDKCTVTETTAYCFVPQTVPDKISLPDDYFQKKFFSVDDLYAIDLESGESNILFKSEFGESQFIDAIYPQYLDGKIYFINRYDRSLYELTL